MRILKIAAATLLCAAAVASSANAQTRYPLHCRGGGDMAVNIQGQETGGGTEIVISYRRAAVTTGLPAGTCAWHDRVLNSREPQSIRIVVRARMSVDFRPRAGDHAAIVLTPSSPPARRRTRAHHHAGARRGGSFQVQASIPPRADECDRFREVPPR